MNRHAYTIALLVVLPLLVGCDETLSEFAGPTPNLTPTFSSIQREVFLRGDSTGRSSCSSCHNRVGTAFRLTGLDLSNDNAYTLLVGVPSREKPSVLRVAPGDPDNTYLVHKIEGRRGIVDDRMPADPPYLTDGQVAIIKRWIELGAQRN